VNESKIWALPVPINENSPVKLVGCFVYHFLNIRYTVFLIPGCIATNGGYGRSSLGNDLKGLNLRGECLFGKMCSVQGFVVAFL